MSSSLVQSSGSHPGPGWLREPAGSDGDLGCEEIQTGEEKQQQREDVNTNHRLLCRLKHYGINFISIIIYIKKNHWSSSQNLQGASESHHEEIKYLLLM